MSVERVPAARPPLYALFQQRMPGDEALLRLAQLRFAQAGLAAEVYAGSPDELGRVLGFAPARRALPMVHLDRGLNVLREADRAAVAGLARPFAGRVAGLVVHDKPAMPDAPAEVVAALRRLSAHLHDGSGPRGSVRLFLEYAFGAELDAFVALGRRLRGVEHVGLCVDTGHVGIRQARRAFARTHPGTELTTLTAADPRLPELVSDVQDAVESALPAVLDVTRSLAAAEVPLHFHLHDGHPLIPGLADHFSFLSRLPVPFEHEGRRSLRPLYGPAGLADIVRTAVSACGAGRVSFTLEIHQAEGRLPLADAADLFSHWRDTTNAERMNYWLSVLAANAALVEAALDPAPAPPRHAPDHPAADVVFSNPD